LAAIFRTKVGLPFDAVDAGDFDRSGQFLRVNAIVPSGVTIDGRFPTVFVEVDRIAIFLADMPSDFRFHVAPITGGRSRVDLLSTKACRSASTP
jgi:hypothetical protein